MLSLIAFFPWLSYFLIYVNSNTIINYDTDVKADGVVKVMAGLLSHSHRVMLACNVLEMRVEIFSATLSSLCFIFSVQSVCEMLNVSIIYQQSLVY